MIDGEGKFTFNKVTEFGVTTPVRTIDEWGMYAGLGYTYVPNDFVVTPHASVAAPTRDIARTFILSTHVAMANPKRTVTRTISIACNFAVSKLESFSRTITTIPVGIAVSGSKAFTRVIPNINIHCSITEPMKAFTRDNIIIPVNCLITMIRNGGFVMKTAGVALYYLDKIRVK